MPPSERRWVACPAATWSYWGVKILVSLVIVGALLFGVDMVARGVAEGRAASYVQSEMELAEEPEVSLGGTPFLIKALGGSIPDVEVKAGRIVAEGLKLEDVVITFDSIDVSLGGLLSGDPKGVTTSGGSGEASISSDSLTDYLRKSGAPVEIMLIRGALAVTSPKLGTQNGDVSIKGDDLLVISPALPEPLAIGLPGITEGLVYENVSITRDAIVLEVSVPAGRLRSPAS